MTKNEELIRSIAKGDRMADYILTGYDKGEYNTFEDCLIALIVLLVAIKPTEDSEPTQDEIDASWLKEPRTQWGQ